MTSKPGLARNDSSRARDRFGHERGTDQAMKSRTYAKEGIVLAVDVLLPAHVILHQLAIFSTQPSRNSFAFSGDAVDLVIAGGKHERAEGGEGVAHAFL